MHDFRHGTTILGNARLIVGLTLKMRHLVAHTGDAIVIIDEISARSAPATMLVQTTTVLIQWARAVHDVGAYLHLRIGPICAWMEGNFIAAEAFTSVIIEMDSSGIVKILANSI